MHFRIHIAIFSLAAISAFTAMAQAPSAPGCTVKQGYYRCDATAFLRVFNDAKTIAIDTQPYDRIATKALSDFAKSVGKTATPDPAPDPSQNPADLTFVLIRTDLTGIVYGPSDNERASLAIYSRGPNGGRGKLIWIEAYYAQPDLAWPAVIHLTIEQFKADIK